MRLIRKNVEREAEGSAAEKLISDGFTPMKKATPDTVPEAQYHLRMPQKILLANCKHGKQKRLRRSLTAL